MLATFGCGQMPEKTALVCEAAQLVSASDFHYLMNHCEVNVVRISAAETVQLDMADGSAQCMAKATFEEADRHAGYRQQKSGCSLTRIQEAR